MYTADRKEHHVTQRVFEPRHVTICSVAPWNFFKEYRYMHEFIDPDTGQRKVSNFTQFALPAAKPESEDGKGYETIKVYDTAELLRDVHQKDGEAYAPAPIYCDDVARDLVDLWSGDMIGNESGTSIGVAVIDGDEPTPAELEELKAHQTAYFDYLLTDANAKFREGRVREITTLHRYAAEWFGRNDLPWMDEIKRTPNKACLACGEGILLSAKKCRHCGTNLVNYAIEGIDGGDFSIEDVGKQDPETALVVGRRLDARQRAAIDPTVDPLGVREDIESGEDTEPDRSDQPAESDDNPRQADKKRTQQRKAQRKAKDETKS